MPARRVADRAGELECVAAEPVGEAGVHRRRGRLLDELLVAPLHGAVALAELDQVAVRVAEHLDLDVSRIGEVPLDVHRAVAEEPVAVGAHRVERRRQLRLVGRDAEADAAAAAATP